MLLFLQADAVGKVQALFSYSRFLLNGKTPYAETYLMVRGNTVRFVRNENGRYQGVLEVIISVSKNGEQRYVDKYHLHSPESADSSGSSFNFIDLQRIPLDTGLFYIDLSIRDINSTAAAVEAFGTIDFSYPVNEVSISDIQPVDSYTKASGTGRLTRGGYDLVPHISEFYGTDENRLIFYAEVYQTLEQLGEGEKFLVRYFIENTDKSQQLSDYSGFKRYTAAEVNVLMNEFDISGLPGGNYSIVLEVVDKENNVLTTRKQQFTRNSKAAPATVQQIRQTSLSGSFVEKYTRRDSLEEHIRCLHPISNEQERIFADNVLKGGDFQMEKQFFLSFWADRDVMQPQAAWEAYRAEVTEVNRLFSTSIRRGYLTDRGRVYLQYGPPDNRTVSLSEPSAYPYEIWHYYKMKKQTNRRFVFYLRDLVTNDYELIHSDALGEVMNPQWQMIIMKRDTPVNSVDDTDPNPHFGTQLQQNYQAPR